MDILDIILGDSNFDNPLYEDEYDNVVQLKHQIKNLQEENKRLEKNIQFLKDSIPLPSDSNDIPIHLGNKVFLSWNRKIRRVISIEYFENGHIYLHCDSGGGFRVDNDDDYTDNYKFYVVDQEEQINGHLCYE